MITFEELVKVVEAQQESLELMHEVLKMHQTVIKEHEDIINALTNRVLNA
jgi:hypothetical protein